MNLVGGSGFWGSAQTAAPAMIGPFPDHHAAESRHLSRVLPGDRPFGEDGMGRNSSMRYSLRIGVGQRTNGD